MQRYRQDSELHGLRGASPSLPPSPRLSLKGEERRGAKAKGVWIPVSTGMTSNRRWGTGKPGPDDRNRKQEFIASRSLLLQGEGKGRRGSGGLAGEEKGEAVSHEISIQSRVDSVSVENNQS
jgi:hypothetical protein